MTGLVLEGGGMRGIYTAGVLDCFLDHQLFFPFVTGVSAGASHACSYIARQRGRSLEVTRYAGDKRYVSMENLMKTGSYFGLDFVFREIPESLIPFDYTTFFGSPVQYYAGTVDIKTGASRFFSKDEMDQTLLPVQASMSLPGIARPVPLDGGLYLDGGVSSPIPLDQSLNKCNRHVIVMTQPAGFVKQPQKINAYLKWIYRKYPKLLAAMRTRHQVYNDTVRLAESLEQEGKAVIIRPSADYHISRIEKNQDRIRMQYELGYHDALQKKEILKEFFSNPDKTIDKQMFL